VSICNTVSRNTAVFIVSLLSHISRGISEGGERHRQCNQTLADSTQISSVCDLLVPVAIMTSSILNIGTA